MTVDITVSATNDAQVENDDAYYVDEDDSLSVNADSGVIDNDTDADADPVTAVLVSDVSNGTLSLLSSGWNEEEATSRFVDAGLAGFLQKPYTPAELAAKVKEALASRGNGQAG